MAHQVAHALGGLAVEQHPLPGLFQRIEAYLDLVRAVQPLGVAVNQRRVRTGGDHLPVVGGTVAPAHGEQVHGLQQVGFSAAVGAVEHGDSRMGRKLQGIVVAEAGQPEGGKAHGGKTSLSQVMMKTV